MFRRERWEEGEEARQKGEGVKVCQVAGNLASTASSVGYSEPQIGTPRRALGPNRNAHPAAPEEAGTLTGL
eukprot:353747-Chlamydomonas_euryale.AAC.10